jgi:hypothetical protein
MVLQRVAQRRHAGGQRRRKSRWVVGAILRRSAQRRDKPRSVGRNAGPAVPHGGVERPDTREAHAGIGMAQRVDEGRNEGPQVLRHADADAGHQRSKPVEVRGQFSGTAATAGRACDDLRQHAVVQRSVLRGGAVLELRPPS